MKNIKGGALMGKYGKIEGYCYNGKLKERTA